jgi:hypothetical protein
VGNLLPTRKDPLALSFSHTVGEGGPQGRMRAGSNDATAFAAMIATSYLQLGDEPPIPTRALPLKGRETFVGTARATFARSLVVGQWVAHAYGAKTNSSARNRPPPQSPTNASSNTERTPRCTFKKTFIGFVDDDAPDIFATRKIVPAHVPSQFPTHPRVA